MRFAVVADTHVRSGDLDPGDFEANTLLEGRNRYVVEVVNRLAPSFVIHLGDVVHPVPGDPWHDAANALAADAYRRLDVPLYVVPGNHDVGDKPFPWVDAPPTAEAHYARFEARWGPRHRAFSHGGCRFVLVDTPGLGTGSEAEARQWAWLEATLSAATGAGERIFLFGHYPPYLGDPDEPEHYDNLAPAVRRRLLDLITRYPVEAVFSGHVHRFFHSRHRDTDFYVVPAVGFVRPDYAEFDAVAPGGEFGRDDRAKLGLFVVDVGSEGHVVRPIRTWGRVQGQDPGAVESLAAPDWKAHLGVTLRHGWAAARELTMDGLDEFTRKWARDDTTVVALWEARIDRIRVPAADLARDDTRRRVEELTARGLRCTVLVPGGAGLGGLVDLAGVERWEVVLAPGEQWSSRIPRPRGGTVAVGPVVPFAVEGRHFVAHGFSPDDPLELIRRRAGDADEVVFRVGPRAPVWETVTAAVDVAATCGFRAVVDVQLPRDGEGRMFDDDARVANRVVEAELAARTHREATLFVDGFVDHDRGYFPRRALLDRRGDPRAGFGALVRLAVTVPPDAPWRFVDADGDSRRFQAGHWQVVLVEEGGFSVDADALSLVDGHRATELSKGPWLMQAGTGG